MALSKVINHPIHLHDLLEIVAGIDPDHPLNRREQRAVEFCRRARLATDQAMSRGRDLGEGSASHRRADRFLSELDWLLPTF